MESLKELVLLGSRINILGVEESVKLSSGYIVHVLNEFNKQGYIPNPLKESITNMALGHFKKLVNKAFNED